MSNWNKSDFIGNKSVGIKGIPNEALSFFGPDVEIIKKYALKKLEENRKERSVNLLGGWLDAGKMVTWDRSEFKGFGSVFGIVLYADDRPSKIIELAIWSEINKGWTLRRTSVNKLKPLFYEGE